MAIFGTDIWIIITIFHPFHVLLRKRILLIDIFAEWETLRNSKAEAV